MGQNNGKATSLINNTFEHRNQASFANSITDQKGSINKYTWISPKSQRKLRFSQNSVPDNIAHKSKIYIYIIEAIFKYILFENMPSALKKIATMPGS